MPSIECLSQELSEIPVNAENDVRAASIAGHLFSAVFYKYWDLIPIEKRNSLILSHGNELCVIYKNNRLISQLNPIDAAKQAIDEELSILVQLLIEELEALEPHEAE